MTVSLPVYVVSLVVAFVYGILKYYLPDLPLTEDTVKWVILGILSLLQIDVVQGLRYRGLI